MSAAVWVRGGLALLAVSSLVNGLWASVAPRSFYDDFPGLGAAWVALLPPFNAHLVTDVGAFYLGFAVVLGWAAWSPAPALMSAALAGYLVFSVPHLIFHVTHLDGFSAFDALSQTLGLVLVVVVPVGLLALMRRRT